MIDRTTEQRIKEVASVTDVLGDFLTLKRHGVELTCPCPFHHGQHLGHFMVNPKKNFYYCFVCGEHGGPIDFLMRHEGMNYPDALRYLGAKYCIDVDEEQQKFADKVKQAKAVPLPTVEELPMLVLPVELVASRRDRTGDPLCEWLHSIPWEKEEQRARVDSVLEAYLVGHSYYGMTIFWYVDEKGRVRTGKMMRYKTDGHRDREAAYSTDWIHSALYRAGRRDLYDREKQQMVTCLFGLHLLHANPRDYTVNIVESEKTALVMAIALGTDAGLWMATGGMQFLKKETITHLRSYGLDIVLHPDHDGAKVWKEKMDKFGFVLGRDYQLSLQFVDALWTEADGPKADAADIMVRRLEAADRENKTRPMKDLINAWKREFPAFKSFTDTFDIEPIKMERYGAE